MNKAIYIYAAAALTLASCSSDEVIRQAERADTISFRGVVGLNTRAVNMTQEKLEKEGMYVTTFTTDGERLYGETPYALTGGAWVSNPPQKWGGNSQLSFFLTSPKLSEWATDFELTADNKAQELLITISEDISTQKDYVVAYLPNANKDEFNKPTEAHLKHVLSSVVIKAKNTNDAFVYQVKGIRFNGVNRKASVNFLTESARHCAIDTKSYELTYSTAVTLNGESQSLMGSAQNAILAPQPEEGTLAQRWDGSAPAFSTQSYISVLVNITSKYGAQVYPAGGGFGWVAIGLPYEWESGKKYVYTLDFSDGAGRVDPNPGNDVNPDGIDPTKPKDPALGKPILGKRVKFGIAVSPWGDGGSTDVTLGDNQIKFTVGVDAWADQEIDTEIN